MEGERRSQRGICLCLVMLFGFSLVPTVQAQAGEVLFDAASFSIADYATFEDEDLAFSVELHEQSGSAANVSLYLVVETLEGAVLSNTTQTLGEFQGLEQRNVSGTFVGLPLGFSTVSIWLDGDVGSNTSSHHVVLTRTVQRLRPLAVTLGGLSSVQANPLDAVGQATGNLTLHDGDRVEVVFPIINNGDVNWSGGVQLSLSNDGSNESVIQENISVGASSSVVVTLSPVMVLSEGALDWQINLTNTSASQPGTHALNGTWAVDAPPLPLLSGLLDSDAETVQAGEELTVSLSIWNNGTVGFSGSIGCTADGVEVFNTTATDLGASSNQTWSFTMTAKPLSLQCDAAGTRIAAESSLPLLLNVDMPSAVFEAAGASTPSFTGGPWHKGDHVDANLLLRNVGDLEGRVRLVLSVGTSSSQGEWVTLGQGAAGEVSASLQFLSSGEAALAWMLESDDGIVTGADDGTTTLVVRQQQSVHLEFSNVNRTDEGDLSLALHVELTSGKDREVLVQVGYETGGATVYLQENNLLLQQGRLELAMVFGDIEADRLVAQVSPVGWLIGPGPLATTASLPDHATQFWMEFSPTTTPIRPLEGDDTTVRITFHQSGPVLDAQGEVWLLDAYGTRLANVNSPSWTDPSMTTLDVSLVWPKGSNVAIQALWHIDATVVSAETTYVSGEPVVESNTEWPIGAILWGLGLGAGISLVLRLRARKDSERSKATPSSPSSTESKPGTSQPVSSKEKREVGCPECNRRLRVPVAYSGSVGCPDCSHKFVVDAVPHAEPDTEENEGLEVEVQPPLEEPLNEKIEISCPDCSQSLRIPSSYDGSVRCPACKKIFKSHEGQ